VIVLRTAAVVLMSASSVAYAQGVTTAGIRGTISGDAGEPLSEARVRIVHAGTGHSIELRSNRGRFLIEGLEPGGPYQITVRRLGYGIQIRSVASLALGELHEIQFVLQRLGTELDTARIRSSYAGAPYANGGTATIIDQSLIAGLPSLNRDFYDFVRLVPQVSTKVGLANGGFSAGGVGFRFNDFLINGVSERSLSGNVASAFSGAKSVPLDAVQEYQVLLAPYDPRYGDFAGAMVNTVTRSGTNEFRGNAFAFGRNDRLARRAGSSTPYDRAQYGFSAGGPLVRDRAHFFLAAERQHFTYPAPGPYVGQPKEAQVPLRVDENDITRMNSIMRDFDLVAGSGGPVTNEHPLFNIFTRLDVSLPRWNTRAVAWNNSSAGDEVVFSRQAPGSFPLSTMAVTRQSRNRMTAIHTHTSLTRAGGAHNEFLVAHRSDALRSAVDFHQPIVRVSVPSDGGSVSLAAGTTESAQGSGFSASAARVKDNLILPLGANHILTVGAEAELIEVHRRGFSGSYGSWTFGSLEDLEAGSPRAYQVTLDLGGASGTPVTAAQYAAYVSDRWEITPRLYVTAGIRGDLLVPRGRAPYHPGIDSLFGRRTDVMPDRRIELSPRIGFAWNPTAMGNHVIRGGAGIFAARYPLAWIQTARSSYGGGTGILRCGNGPRDIGPPPPFEPDFRAQPRTCANNAGITSSQRGNVNLLATDLRLMRIARASIAYERKIPGDIAFSAEVLATRALTDFTFVNLNLHEPQTSDAHGRVMYGSITSTGVASPALREPFSEVIDLRNTSGARSIQVSTGLRKKTGDRATWLTWYTWSRASDAQAPLRVNVSGTVSWGSARPVAGRHDDFTRGTGSNDIPHRIVAGGQFALARQLGTTLSFYYVGESGRPFTYIAFGGEGKGDLNADGSNINDPVYVPGNALDSDEIVFDGTTADALGQSQALQDLIDRTPCLRRQRGSIMKRNSCREPWSSMTIASLRQPVPFTRGLEAQADVYNVLNLLNNKWGLHRQASVELLEHVGQTAGPAPSRPVFRLAPGRGEWTILQPESGFQLQLALRYRF
jgi:hypothetical protein